MNDEEWRDKATKILLSIKFYFEHPGERREVISHDEMTEIFGLLLSANKKDVEQMKCTKHKWHFAKIVNIVKHSDRSCSYVKEVTFVCECGAYKEVELTKQVEE